VCFLWACFWIDASILLYPAFGYTVSWVRCARLEDDETVNFRLNLTFIEEKTELDK
jgi:hypothetical protein